MTGNSAEAAYPGSTRATRHRAPLLLVAACTTALTLLGCARTSGGEAGGTRSTAGADTGVAPQSAQPAATGAGTGTGTSTGTGTGTSTGTGGSSGGGTPTHKPSSASPASGPQIVYFTVQGSAACPENGPDFNSPGGVTITWKVTGATKVALSIDDPTFYARYGTGSYGSYGPTDTLNLPFSCSVPHGQTQTHTYTLDTMDGGAHRSMTIKASAINNG